MKEKPFTPIEKELISSCKNCETSFNGNYCPNCGQSKKEYNKPFWKLVIDFAGTIFAFDARLWYTFRSLIFKPGQIANDYNHGKRIRYTPPFRFYIFISFLFFLLLGYSTNKSENTPLLDDPTFLGDSGTDSDDIDNIDSLINLTKRVILDSLSNSDRLNHPIDNGGPEKAIEKIDTSVAASSSPIINDDDNEINLNSDKILELGNNRKLDINDIKLNKGVYLEKFFKSLSRALFFLMPIYAFFLWVFFRKTYKYYLGHLILAITQHSFTFLLLSIIMLIQLLFPDKSSSPEFYLMLGLPLYYVIGAKRMYGRRWRSTIFRLIIIWSAYFIISAGSIVTILFFTFTKI